MGKWKGMRSVGTVGVLRIVVLPSTPVLHEVARGYFPENRLLLAEEGPDAVPAESTGVPSMASPSS